MLNHTLTRSTSVFASTVAGFLLASSAFAATEIKLGWTTSDSEVDPYAIPLCQPRCPVGDFA